MLIYLAGNAAMSKEERVNLYKLFKNRLLSYYESLPGRFGYSQWIWIKTNINKNGIN